MNSFTQAKICAVTGAASGIGKALVHAYAELGYKLVAIDRDVQLLDRLKSELADIELLDVELLCIDADLQNRDDLEKISQKLQTTYPQGIDLFIHSAGINATGRFSHVPVEKQMQVVDINLLAPMQLTSKLLREKVMRTGGSLVFVSSLSRYVGYPSATGYAASKDGIASYARCLRLSLAPENISVLTVYPGPTRTPHAREHSPDNSREHKRMAPETLANYIVKAVDKRQSVLIPGIANKVFSGIGIALPSLTERLMRSSLLKD